MIPAPVSATPIKRHVAMIIYPGCVMLDACGPMEVFEFANHYFALTGNLADSEKAYSMSFIADKSGPVVTSSGLKLVADFGYDTVDKDIDTLIIAGAPQLLDIQKDVRLCAFLNTMLPKVRRMVSICTGARLRWRKAGYSGGAGRPPIGCILITYIPNMKILTLKPTKFTSAMAMFTPPVALRPVWIWR